MSHAPILFIHYGAAPYLRMTLSAARRSNPKKPVILLGDEENRSLVPSGVEFVPFAPLAQQSERVRRFREVFRPIAGERHRFRKAKGMEYWLRFVFERWLIIDEFLASRSISQFWTFDSDTLIASDLELREKRLSRFDASEQCGGGCINGWVHQRSMVRDYTDYLISIFADEAYLNLQRERLKKHAGLAFTEMDAWQSFRDLRSIKTHHLQKPLDGEAFDDALGITRGWRVRSQKIRGRISVKEIYGDVRGGFFAFESDSNLPVRFLTLNLSWLPDYCYKRLEPFCHGVPVLPFEASSCRPVNLREPVLERLNGLWWNFHGRCFKK